MTIAIMILMAASGCAALIYEIVWLQLLQLIIGSSAVSLGLLLGTYMGGLFLGSVAFPKLISARQQHPLRMYALLECGIGIFGVLILSVLPVVGRVYANIAMPGLLGLVLRGSICAACLLPPTILMGATFPAVSRWLESSTTGMSRLGFFYAANIAGAVFGCVVAGFYLLRVHDLAIATYVAAGINLLVALSGFVLSSRSAYQAASYNASRDAVPRVAKSDAICVGVAFSGLCALGAQVVWTRVLSV